MAITWLANRQVQPKPDSYLFFCPQMSATASDVPAFGSAMTADSSFSGIAGQYAKIALSTAPILVAMSKIDKLRYPGRYFWTAVYEAPLTRSEA